MVASWSVDLRLDITLSASDRRWLFTPCNRSRFFVSMGQCRILVVVGVLLAPSAESAEIRVLDVGAVVESLPTQVSAQWQDRLGDGSSSGQLSSAWATGAGVRCGWGPAGRPWLGAMGLAVVRIAQHGDTIDDTGYALRGEAGGVYALNHRLAVTLMPLIGIGRMSAELTPAIAEPVALTGNLFEVGIRSGVRWQLSEYLVLGSEIGWRRASEHLSGDGASLTLQTTGLWVGLSLAWLLDARPMALD